MKTKTIILTILLMLTTLGAWAQNGKPRLVVWQKSGGKAYFDLDKLPETSFDNGILTIKSSTATYPTSSPTCSDIPMQYELKVKQQ